MLIEETRQIQERWFAFLEKLEQRMQEVCEAAVPELKDVYASDTDPYKRAHGRMLSGLLGQISQMRQKANEVREEKVIGLKLHEFQMACYERHRIFEDNVTKYEELLQSAVGEPDLETPYRNLLEDFEKTKDRFKCTQCGGNITIPRLFAIATYVSCPHCQTQNTFYPSTEAQMVLHNARALAEQRTKHLLKAYESSETKDPALYRQYLRAMFDEWNSITPDMAAENEKFHERLLKDQQTYNQ